MMLDNAMSEAANERFIEYFLELLGTYEKKNEALKNHVRELTARVTAAESRLGEFEEEIMRLRKQLHRHVKA